MTSEIKIRTATKEDHGYIFELSPRLAEVANLAWHDRDVVQQMQDDYIDAMLIDTSLPFTLLIAEDNATSLGFAHVKEHKDDISGEDCAMITLLAVSPIAQGKGVGLQLMQAAEHWAKQQGYRLLHLEVFANNDNAQEFYQKLEFKPEMITMVKTL
jgi:ribosomal protein S18 acetylase RimI-like enzyme